MIPFALWWSFPQYEKKITDLVAGDLWCQEGWRMYNLPMLSVLLPRKAEAFGSDFRTVSRLNPAPLPVSVGTLQLSFSLRQALSLVSGPKKALFFVLGRVPDH